MNGIIYIAISPSNKKYIGKSSRTLDIRIKEHNKKSKIEDFHFSRAIRKYGIENFKWNILETFEDISEDVLNEREKYWIKREETYSKGYNMTEGGEGSSGLKRIFTDEHRRKLSESHTGKILSESHKKRIGESGKGRKVSADTRKKMSDLQKDGKGWMNGNNPSEKTRSKLSEASKKVKKIKCESCGNEFAPWTYKRHANKCNKILK